MIRFFVSIIIFLMANLQAIQTQVVILLGPPGAGKGSQATLIKEEVGIAHISTGDLLRENIKKETTLGKNAKVYMDAGQLVPDDLIFAMLFARLDEPDCKKGYILDGFPRNISQAEILQKKLLDQYDVVAIHLDVSDAILVDRITKRYVCASCQTPYHLSFSPPKVAGKCDRCHGDLYQRSDDTKEVIEKRLKVYHKQTKPLIDFYEKQKKFHKIDSNVSKEDITQEILTLLKNLHKKSLISVEIIS